MKVGDLVRINTRALGSHPRGHTGIIVCLKSFEHGKNLQPIVLIDGKLRLYGESVCEVISESR